VVGRDQLGFSDVGRRCHPRRERVMDPESHTITTAVWVDPFERSRARVMSAQRYVRFAALGDSMACAMPSVNLKRRSWAQMLAAALGTDHEVSFFDASDAGATACDVRRRQLVDALEHRPTLAAVISGLHDAMRSNWDAETTRYRLMRTADELSWCGAHLLTIRFHDHASVLAHGGSSAAVLRSRVDQLNDIYDEIDDAYGGTLVDLREHPEPLTNDFWSAHPLHPSTQGHALIADWFANALAEDRVLASTPARSPVTPSR